MYKIKIASYIHSKTMFGKWIRFKQRYIDKLEGRYSRVSHSEIVFVYNDNKEVLKRLKRLENNVRWDNTLTEPELFKNNNLWFSSSEVDNWTRFKFIEDNKSNWIYYDIEVTKEDYLKMLDFAISQQGQKYNWLWIIFAQWLWVNWFRKKNDWFCSQITLSTLQQIWLYCWIDAVNISPWKLAQLWELNN